MVFTRLMKMTEYKIGMFSFLNHLPILILEGALIYGATFTNLFQWIWIMITCLIAFVTLVTLSVNSGKIYGVSEKALTIRIGKKTIKEYLYTQIKTIRIRKRNMEIGFKDKEKVKTVYLGWYIRKYRKMEDQLLGFIKQFEQYDRIIFID